MVRLWANDGKSSFKDRGGVGLVVGQVGLATRRGSHSRPKQRLGDPPASSRNFAYRGFGFLQSQILSTYDTGGCLLVKSPQSRCSSLSEPSSAGSLHYSTATGSLD